MREHRGAVGAATLDLRMWGITAGDTHGAVGTVTGEAMGCDGGTGEYGH